jgi:hypothetical protein
LPPGAAETAPAANEEPEDERHEQARLEQAAQAERRLHERLDARAATSGDSGSSIGLVRRNVDALLALEATRAGLVIEDVRCSASLCRVAARMPPALRANGELRSKIYETVAAGMAEMTMRSFEGDRTVFYLAPPGHEIPSASL